jgi:hypothetical protein
MICLKILKKYQFTTFIASFMANLFFYFVDFEKFICFNYGKYLGINRIYVWVMNEVCLRRVDFRGALPGARTFNTQECLS